MHRRKHNSREDRRFVMLIQMSERCKDYPCYDPYDREEFDKALVEGRYFESWHCKAGEYWRSAAKDGLPVELIKKQPCPLVIKRKKELEALKKRFEEPEPTFENFDVSCLRNPEIVDKIKNFHQSEDKNLMLMGGTGSGKTHLARAFLNSRKNKVDDLVFSIKAVRLYDLFFKKSQRDTAREAEEILQSIKDYYYLFIDDLGDEKHTDTQLFNREFKLMVEEYDMSFIYTSNLNCEDMKSLYGEKLYSRIFHRTDLKIVDAPDYRVRHLKMEVEKA
jgi:DNA replication protein DnaC